MGIVNRYTKLQTPRFNPMSLQELMAVPAYKRKQHDSISENLANTENSLAQVDPLDIHSEAAKQEQERLYNALNEQAEALNSKGFTPTSKSNFLKLNKDFQQSIGPSGTIGKIQQAKVAMSKERDDYIKNATKAGYSPDAAGINWDRHVEEYSKQFSDTGKINNIGSLYAPEYKDAVGELRGLFKEAGMSSSDLSNLGSNIKFDDTKGSYVITSKARKAYSNNIKQLESAVDYINNQVNNPNSTIGKSLVHNNKTPEGVLQEISGLSNVFQKDSVVKDTSNKISNFKPLDNSSNGITSNGGGLTVASTQYTPANFSGQSYRDLNDTIQEMDHVRQEQGELTPEQEAQYLEMTDFKNSIEDELKDNKEYQELKAQYDNLSSSTTSYENNTLYQAVMNDPNLQDRDFTENKVKSMIDQNKIKELNSLEEKMSDIANPILADNKLKITEYAITPVTSKQRTQFNIINENADRLLRVSPQSLEQLGDITQIIDPNGEPKAITSEADRQGIANLIFNANKGSIEVVSHVAKGSSGKPEAVFRINTKEDNSYDLDGILNRGGFTGDIGGGKAVQVRLAFDTSNNEVGVNNLIGLLQDYTASTGPVGREFVESQKINAAISKYRGQTWDNIINSGVVKSDPALLNVYTTKLRELGVTENSTDAQIQEAIKELKSTRLYK